MTPQEQENLDKFLAEQEKQEQKIETPEQPKKTEEQEQERAEVQETEKPQEKKQKKESSFFRKQIKKIAWVLLPLGIIIAGQGCEQRKDKNFNEIKKQARSYGHGQYTNLISKTVQESGYAESIWEDPKTGRRLELGGHYKGDYYYYDSFSEIPSEEEKKAEKEKLKQQGLAAEQQRQAEAKQAQEIREKAKEYLEEAREMMYSYEYNTQEMRALMNQAQEVYEFAGEETPEAIKNFLEGERWAEEDLVDLAQRIDEETTFSLAEQIARSPQRNYEGWRDYNEMPNIEKKLENIIKYTLPKGWANYNVEKIIFDVNYQGAMLGELKDNDIFIYVDKNTEEAFVHEYTHAAGDARFSENMPLGMRIKLLKAMQKFYENNFELDVKFGTDDPEKIKKIHAQHAGEALAHTMDDYLRNPDDVSLHFEDQKFCENYLKVMDSDFDARKAAELREKIFQGWRIKETSEGKILLLPPENR